MNGLTGNVDTDRLILLRLDDKKVTSFCNTNHYYRDQVCNESFWKQRSETYNIDGKGKPDTTSWRDWYAIQRSIEKKRKKNPTLYHIAIENTSKDNDIKAFLQTLPLKVGDLLVEDNLLQNEDSILIVESKEK